MEDGSPRNAPLLVTAELPPDIYSWAEGLRRQHYPPERNRVRAHVTLFHALPPSVEDEVRRLLAHHAKAPPPKARRTPRRGGRRPAIFLGSVRGPRVGLPCPSLAPQ